MRPVEIRASKTVRLSYTAMAGLGVLLVVWQTWRLGTLEALAVGALMLLAVASTLLPMAYGVLLVIDDHGIRYRDPRHPFGLVDIAWDQIATVATKWRGSMLVLSLYDPQAARQRLWFGHRFDLAVSRTIWGYEFGVAISGLDMPAEEVLRLVRERIQAAQALSPESGRSSSTAC